MEPDEQELAGRARHGKRDAAAKLIELYYERLYAFLRRLAQNEADAADLTQRAFARIWQALPGFEGRSSVSSWMHGIAYHVYVDWRRANHHTESRPEEWWAACPALEGTPAERVAEADLARAIYRGVDELEAGLRDTVHLHYYQGLTLEETAAALGVAASTVKYRLRQALAKLRKRLQAEPGSARNLIPAKGL